MGEVSAEWSNSRFSHWKLLKLDDDVHAYDDEGVVITTGKLIDGVCKSMQIMCKILEQRCEETGSPLIRIKQSSYSSHTKQTSRYLLFTG